MDAAQSASSHPETMEERCETFHDYYLIEVYTPFALTVTNFGQIRHPHRNHAPHAAFSA